MCEKDKLTHLCKKILGILPFLIDLCEVAVGQLEKKEDSKNKFHGKQIAKSKVKIREFYAGITFKM